MESRELRSLDPDTPAARRQFERRMEARRLEPGDEAGLRALRRGWLLGSEAFRQQMLEEAEGKVCEHHFGKLRLETADAKAERIVAEELKRRKWVEADLAKRRKSDPEKLAIAVRLRRETTLSVKSIGRWLLLGSSKSATIRLRAAMAAARPITPTAQSKPTSKRGSNHV